MSVRIVVSVTEITEMNPKDRYVVEGIALSTATENVGDGIQGHENDTDPLQSLSHLDPPVDSVYMICGVLIAMVLVGVIIVLLAVTISKLRKREDSNAVHPEAAVVQTATVSASTVSAIVSNHHHHHHHQVNVATTTATTTMATMNNGNNNNNNNNNPNNCGSSNEQENNVYATNGPTGDQFVWQFPPPYPPPQYTLYNDQDTLVHTLPADRPGFAKGFRKNFGGRWRRLVKRKPETETCAIPPELKDQLKTIYVY